MKKRAFSWLLAGMLLLWVDNGAFAAGKKRGEKKSETVVYQNKYFGFRFEYPKEWKLQRPAGICDGVNGSDLKGKVHFNASGSNEVKSKTVGQLAKEAYKSGRVVSQEVFFVKKNKEQYPAILCLYQKGQNTILELFTKRNGVEYHLYLQTHHNLYQKHCYAFDEIVRSFQLIPNIWD